MIDTMFFRGESAHQDRLKIFTRELTNAVALTEILRILREQISVSLLPSLLHIYIHDPLSDQYVASLDETGQISSDIRFAVDSPLPVVLRREQLPIFVDQGRMPEAIRAERGGWHYWARSYFSPCQAVTGWWAGLRWVNVFLAKTMPAMMFLF
jgi:hypothetical protein